MRSLIKSISLFLVLFASCIRESETTYIAYISNETPYKINILPHKGGYVYPKDVINIEPYQTVEIASGFMRGINGQGGFSSAQLGNADSVTVSFDGQYQVLHYSIQPDSPAAKHLPYTSTRNIGNYKSYLYEYKDLNKHARTQKYTYVFTEADYDFAKD